MLSRGAGALLSRRTSTARRALQAALQSFFLADLSKDRHCSLQPTPSEAWEVSVHS